MSDNMRPFFCCEIHVAWIDRDDSVLYIHAWCSQLTEQTLKLLAVRHKLTCFGLPVEVLFTIWFHDVHSLTLTDGRNVQLWNLQLPTGISK